MTDPGRVEVHTLSDGRLLEYWEGGDPDGRPLLLQDGTPTTYALALPIHDLAVEHGWRFVSVNRPGYGKSTPTVASLATVAEDAVELTRHLGFDRYAVVGLSGGGPYASAIAVQDADHVQVLGVADAIGPWRLLEADDVYPAERAALATADADGVESARPAMLAMAESEDELGALRPLDDASRVDAFFAPFKSPLAADPTVRAAWAASLRLTLDGPYGLEGYVSDNLAWGGPWDVDISAVRAPTFLWFAEGEPGQPSVHGRWYAEQIPQARMTVLAGQDHLQICFASWPRFFPDLATAWDG